MALVVAPFPSGSGRGHRLFPKSGFIGKVSAREFDAQANFSDPNPFDEIDDELEIEFAAEESESESSFEDDVPDQPDAIPANNTSDLFELFLRQPGLHSSTAATKLTTTTTLASHTTGYQPYYFEIGGSLHNSRLHQTTSSSSETANYTGDRIIFTYVVFRRCKVTAVRAGDGVLRHGIRTQHHFV